MSAGCAPACACLKYNNELYSILVTALPRAVCLIKTNFQTYVVLCVEYNRRRKYIQFSKKKRDNSGSYTLLFTVTWIFYFSYRIYDNIDVFLHFVDNNILTLTLSCDFNFADDLSYFQIQ